MSERDGPTWVAEVKGAPASPDAAGFGLDRPSPGETGHGWTVTFGGWIVGQLSSAREVHLLLNGELVRRARVDVERGDVAEHLRDRPCGNRAGFWFHIGLLGLPTSARLELCAMLEDDTPVHLATVVVDHDPVPASYPTRLAPITVTSLGRMGTTWLMRLLGAHPEVVVHQQYPHELGVAKYWSHQLSVLTAPADHLDSSHPDSFAADRACIGHNPYAGDFLATSPELRAWFAARYPELLAHHARQAIDECYLQVASQQAVETPRYFAEKGLPDHVPDVLHDLYPGARELILVRDIRDVLCSALAFDEQRGRQSFGRELLDDDLAFVDQLGMDFDRLVTAWRTRQDSALLVRYEELIAEPARAVGEILRYLELPASRSTIDAVLERAADTTTELSGHRTSASPASSVGRWVADLADRPELLERCEEVFSPQLAELGYQTSHPGRRAREMQRTVDDALARWATAPA